MHRRTASEELIQTVLGRDYVHLSTTNYNIQESLGNGACMVSLKLLRKSAQDHIDEISGSGVGFVDAVYNGLIDHYAPEFPSLRTISFTGFEVTGNMGTSLSRGADAECIVSLTVNNSDGKQFRFEDRGRSLVAAALRVVVESAEYFINSEKAYVTVYNAMNDAKKRQRPDLMESYMSQLAELVKTTSYSEVIERIQSIG
jgi:hypothetical protein